ncbi:protocatechuate 3,4-dioxygenase beta subunit [Paenibacillus phyllosphaerae]|uniref:Protocatechuate 3,4-dioxygenase beta subunit n=1 Tax=Paenibacillus phyllosphaerae TaxID=274593 RepID=A0A7W5FM02_9BACL|nr:stalk domain-containing protein [Paenibacillus phyllosphaerae]MBB3109736.1 protocatechuate 3,4-dioxygenase beta subunit [Paenibacillus phyllosphaerae]
MLKKWTTGYKGFVTGVVLTAVLTVPFTSFADAVQKKITVTYNNIKVTMNGQAVSLKDANGNTVEPFAYNGSVYLPLRTLAETLGMDVTYTNSTQTVALTNSTTSGTGGAGGTPPTGTPPTGSPPTGNLPSGTPGTGGSTGGTTNTTGTSAASSDQTAVDDTGLTVQVTQGPYYVTGTNPLTNGVLNYDNLEGTKIKVKGYVYAGATGTKPVAGAKVEIWHADSSGNYHPNSNGAASNYETDEISLRGYVLTDANGYYEYTTIYPGEYEGRTRHIHTNTTATGYTGVITQLIIPSLADDKMAASEDNIAQSLPAYNKVVFTDVDGVPTATYNYRLAAK